MGGYHIEERKHGKFGRGKARSVFLEVDFCSWVAFRVSMVLHGVVYNKLISKRTN